MASPKDYKNLSVTLKNNKIVPKDILSGFPSTETSPSILGTGSLVSPTTPTVPSISLPPKTLIPPAKKAGLSTVGQKLEVQPTEKFVMPPVSKPVPTIIQPQPMMAGTTLKLKPEEKPTGIDPALYEQLKSRGASDEDIKTLSPENVTFVGEFLKQPFVTAAEMNEAAMQGIRASTHVLVAGIFSSKFLSSKFTGEELSEEDRKAARDESLRMASDIVNEKVPYDEGMRQAADNYLKSKGIGKYGGNKPTVGDIGVLGYLGFLNIFGDPLFEVTAGLKLARGLKELATWRKVGSVLKVLPEEKAFVRGTEIERELQITPDMKLKISPKNGTITFTGYRRRFETQKGLPSGERIQPEQAAEETRGLISSFKENISPNITSQYVGDDLVLSLKTPEGKAPGFKQIRPEEVLKISERLNVLEQESNKRILTPEEINEKVNLQKQLGKKEVSITEKIKPEDDLSGIFRGTKGLSADDIMKKHPDIQLKRDTPATDVYGNKVKIPEGEALTPYELKGNKVLLQDGQTYVVSKNQFQNIKGQSVVAEAKPFAPELQGLEESVRGGQIKDAPKVIPGDRASLEASNEYLRNVKTKFEQYQLPGGKNYKEILIKAPIETKPARIDAAGYEISGEPKTVPFMSSHYPEDINLISHLRLNERTYKGQKVTFMEEAQSDWAREGREKGFAPTDMAKAQARYDTLRKSESELSSRMGEIYKKSGKNTEWLQLEKEFNKIHNESGVLFKQLQGTPHHPLVEGGKWVEPTVKRGLQKAVANDSEYFAWITGEQTSARYNLSIPLKEVKWKTTGTAKEFAADKIVELETREAGLQKVWLKKDGTIIKGPKPDWAGQKLDQAIGKGLADQIMGKESGMLSGEGLKFGGEWADNLYGKAPKAQYIGKDTLTGKPVNMADEIAKKPKYQKTGDKDFDAYSQEYYQRFEKEIKPQLLKHAKAEFDEAGKVKVIDVDMSGSYKRGTPNPESDLDVKVYYEGTKPVDEFRDQPSTLSDNIYGIHDVHFQKVELKSELLSGQVKNIVEDVTGGKVEVLDMGLPIEKGTLFYEVEYSPRINGRMMPEEGAKLTAKNIKIGKEIARPGAPPSEADKYIITDILGDGKFKAVAKGNTIKLSKDAESGTAHGMRQLPDSSWYFPSNIKDFDISAKTTTQQGIRLTPEIKARIRGEAPQIKKPSGKQIAFVKPAAERPAILDIKKIPGSQAKQNAKEIITRLKLENVVQHDADIILTGESKGSNAFAAALGNEQWYTKEVPEFSGEHETVHTIYDNVDKMKIMKDAGVTKEALNKELRDKHLDLDKRDIKEVLSENYEIYKQRKTQGKPKGILERFFDAIINFFKKIFNKDNKTTISKFYEVVEKGKAKEPTFISEAIKGRPETFMREGKKIVSFEKDEGAFAKKLEVRKESEINKELQAKDFTSKQLINDNLKTKFNKTFEKASKSEARNAFIETDAIVLKDEKVFDKITNPKKGIEWNKFKQQPRLKGFLNKGILTDAYILVNDKQVANKIYNKQMMANASREARKLAKFGADYKEAYDNEISKEKQSIKEFEKESETLGVEKILPKKPSTKNASIQGYFSTSGEIYVSITNGETNAVVNADKLAFLRETFPNAQLAFEGVKTPIQFIEGGKVKGLLMPTTIENKFDVTGVEKEVKPATVIKAIAERPKPKAKEAVKVEKVVTEKPRPTISEALKKIPEKPVVKEEKVTKEIFKKFKELKKFSAGIDKQIKAVRETEKPIVKEDIEEVVTDYLESKSKQVAKKEEKVLFTEKLIAPKEIKRNDFITIITPEQTLWGEVSNIIERFDENNKLFGYEVELRKGEGKLQTIDIAKDADDIAIYRQIKRTAPSLERLGLERKPTEVPTTEEAVLKLRMTEQERGSRLGFKAGAYEARKKTLDLIRKKNVDIEDIKTQIIEYVKEQIPPDERGKFLVTVRDAKTVNNLIEAFSDIDFAALNIAKKKAVEKLQKKLKKISESDSIAVDYKEKIADLVSGVEIQGHRQSTIDKLNNLDAYIKQQISEGKNVVLPKEILESLKILERRPIDKMSFGEILAINDRIDMLEQAGRLKLRTIKEIDKLEKELILKDLVSETKKMEDTVLKVAPLGEKLHWTQQLGNAVATSWNVWRKKNLALRPMDVVFDLLDGSQGYIGANYRHFKKSSDFKFNLFLKANADLADEVWDLKKKLKLDDTNFDRIGAYAANVQEGGRQKLINMGYTEKEIDNVVLTAEEMEMYNHMRKRFDELRPLIEDVLLRYYNIRLGKVENYFSFLTDWASNSNSFIEHRYGMGVEELGVPTKNTYKTKNVKKGFSVERTDTKGKQRIKINAMDIFLNHVSNATYFVHMAKDIRQLSEVANSAAYEKVAGTKGAETVRDWLDLMARQGGVDGQKQLRWLDNLRRNVSAGTLAFKLSSILVQGTAIFDGAALIGNYSFSGLNDIVTSKEWRHFLAENFPEWKNRGIDDPAFIEFSPNKTIARAQQVGYSALQKLDSLVAAGVTAGAYRKYLNEHGLELDFNKPNKEALSYALLMMRRTQASAFYKDLPLALSRGALTGNKTFDKLLLHFQTFTLNKWSLRHDFARLGIQKKDYKKASRIVFWLIVAAMATVGVRRLSKKVEQGLVKLLTGEEQEKDEKDKSFSNETLMDLFTTIPFMSQAVSVSAYGREPFPLAEAGKATVRDIKSMLTGKEAKTRAAGAVGAIAGPLKLAGIPGTTQAQKLLQDLIRNWPRKKSPTELKLERLRKSLKKSPGVPNQKKISKERMKRIQEYLKNQ